MSHQWLLQRKEEENSKLHYWRETLAYCSPPPFWLINAIFISKRTFWKVRQRHTSNFRDWIPDFATETYKPRFRGNIRESIPEILPIVASHFDMLLYMSGFGYFGLVFFQIHPQFQDPMYLLKALLTWDLRNSD